MIIDHPTSPDEMTSKAAEAAAASAPTANPPAAISPPSYDAVVGAAGPSTSNVVPKPPAPIPKVHDPSYPIDTGFSRYTGCTTDATANPPVTVYHYQHPVTNQVITSCLPPDHPEMVCLQQGHVTETRYGILGVLAAVFWFPLGIALCCLDRRIHCRRCGHVIEDGFSC